MTVSVVRTTLSIGLLVALFLPAAPASAEVEPRAAEIAQRSLDAMGGADAWQDTRFLRFDFFGFRLHHWDRYTGRHRLEGKNREGQSYVVLHDIDSRQGRAWLDGQELEGEDLEKWLEQAYGAWINDTYWLLMPYKLLDPGVHLSWDGEATEDGKTFDKLKLTFESVGLTPGDTYWAWIDRETGLMDRWAYFLQDWPEDREPTVWRWTDWQKHGDIMLSSTRIKLDDQSERGLGQIAVLDQLDDAVFESPDPVR